MRIIIVPASRLRICRPLLLSAVCSLLSGCGSNLQPEPVVADDSVPYADKVGMDYALHSPDVVRGNEYAMGHVTLDIEQGGNHSMVSDAREISAVSAIVPMGVNMTRAVLAYDDVDELGVDYRRADACDVGERVTCRFEGAQIRNASLEIDYKVFAPGDHEFTAFVDTRDRDPDPANNVRTMIFRYVASTRYLQSLLDTTATGGSVTLPSGTYMGTLHGGNRSLNVHGADDGGTVLLSDNPDMALLENIGNGSTFSNLEFRSSGAPVLVRSGFNITIEDSLIAPTEGTRHVLHQLFVNNSYRLLYSRVEGWGGEHGDCRSLLVTGPHYADPGLLTADAATRVALQSSTTYVGKKPYSSNTRPSGIYIQNTLFRNNTCDNLLLDYSTKPRPYSAAAAIRNTDPSLFILNNTFVENRGRIQFSGNRVNDVHVRNNIFVAHHDPITLSRASDPRSESRFFLAGNLVWDSHFESLLSADAAAGPTVWIEAPELTADPLFVDRDGGDFSLATGSPAIDAGARIDAYRWTDPKSGVSVVPPAQASHPTPVDGLLDGNAIMDIGAFEYIP